MPWAAPRRLPDGRQIRYMPREAAARVGGFPVYENRSGDHLVLTKRDRGSQVHALNEDRHTFLEDEIGPRDDLGVLNKSPKWVTTSQRQSAEPLS
jgi:hypothetical protein